MVYTLFSNYHNFINDCSNNLILFSINSTKLFSNEVKVSLIGGSVLELPRHFWVLMRHISFYRKKETFLTSVVKIKILRGETTNVKKKKIAIKSITKVVRRAGK